MFFCKKINYMFVASNKKYATDKNADIIYRYGSEISMPNELYKPLHNKLRELTPQAADWQH